MFSRQNSNSTLTFNQETSTVSFSTAPPSLQAQTRSSQVTTPRKNREASSNHRDSLDTTYRNTSNLKELSETAYRNGRDYSEPMNNHRDSLNSGQSTPTNHRDLSDSETDSSNKNSSSRYNDSHGSYGSQLRQNGDSLVEKRPQYAPVEHIDPVPEAELDGHQVCYK